MEVWEIGKGQVQTPSVSWHWKMDTKCHGGPYRWSIDQCQWWSNIVISLLYIVVHFSPCQLIFCGKPLIHRRRSAVELRYLSESLGVVGSLGSRTVNTSAKWWCSNSINGEVWPRYPDKNSFGSDWFVAISHDFSMVVIDESVVMQRKYVKRFPIKTPNRRCSKGSDQITENWGSLAQDVAGTLRPFSQENAWLESNTKWIHKKLKIHAMQQRIKS